MITWPEGVVWASVRWDVGAIWPDLLMCREGQNCTSADDREITQTAGRCSGYQQGVAYDKLLVIRG